MTDIYEFLAQNEVPYQRLNHPPVFTCEEATELVPEFDGAETKNLFIKDKKGRKHFLVVVGYEKNVDLKKLEPILEAKNISLASPDRLMRHLGLEPGSVTVLGLVNDKEHKVRLVVDESLWNQESWGCHPLVNTSTLVIKRTDIERFLKATGHEPLVANLPGRE